MRLAETIKGEIPVYVGLSTDDKPGGTHGARMICVDTGERWIYNEDMWIFDLSGPKLTDGIYNS